MLDPALAAVVEHSGGSYPVVAGWGVIERLGDKFVDLGIAGPVYILLMKTLCIRTAEPLSGPCREVE